MRRMLVTLLLAALTGLRGLAPTLGAIARTAPAVAAAALATLVTANSGCNTSPTSPSASASLAPNVLAPGKIWRLNADGSVTQVDAPSPSPTPGKVAQIRPDGTIVWVDAPATASAAATASASPTPTPSPSPTGTNLAALLANPPAGFQYSVIGGTIVLVPITASSSPGTYYGIPVMTPAPSAASTATPGPSLAWLLANPPAGYQYTVANGTVVLVPIAAASPTPGTYFGIPILGSQPGTVILSPSPTATTLPIPYGPALMSQTTNREASFSGYNSTFFRDFAVAGIDGLATLNQVNANTWKIVAVGTHSNWTVPSDLSLLGRATAGTIFVPLPQTNGDTGFAVVAPVSGTNTWAIVAWVDFQGISNYQKFWWYDPPNAATGNKGGWKVTYVATGGTTGYALMCRPGFGCP